MLATETAQDHHHHYLARSAAASFKSRDPSLELPRSVPGETAGMASQPNRHGSMSNPAGAATGVQTGPFKSKKNNRVSPPLSGIPQRNDNIMNVRAGTNSSLYQICLNLRRRLTDVPGFYEHIAEMEEEEAEINDSTDPVTSMWNCFRRGYPLLTVYNALKPAVPIEVDSVKHGESRIAKQATYEFLKACRNELKFPSQDLFLIADLYNEDTTGFVKVTKVVNRILDILEQKGLLMQRAQSAIDAENSQPEQLSHRQKIVQELVKTERDYCQHLELLQQFKNEVEQKGALAGDTVHNIFLNLNQLLDFQRRFLIRIEQQNCLPEAQQNWGKLFFHYKDAFRVYEPFIANQIRCREALGWQWEKLQRASIGSEFSDMVESQATILGFLLKPFQRLTRYPMLLGELREKGGLDEQRRKDLADGIAAAKSILDRANEAMRREERHDAVVELQSRVEDWKGHKIDHFGELLVYGNHTVLKGEGSKQVEREYKVFLFERILLCCKEVNMSKPKNRMLGNSKPLADGKGKPKLQLKGRIFMQNVTDVIRTVLPDKPWCTLQIYWKGDPGVENFTIRFNDQKTTEEWEERVLVQKKILSTSTSRRSGSNGTSATEFSYMEAQPRPENPYRETDEIDEEDEIDSRPTTGNPDFSMSRNASNTSLRSIPGQPPGSRMPPSRYPYHEQGQPGYPPLIVNTNIPHGAQSPGEAGARSYFSPANDSPVSTRSSSQASMYGFSSGRTPMRDWSENNKHRTAPAMGRAPSREGPPPSTRPSLTAMATSQYPGQQLSLNQSRLRSASTPDINAPGRRTPNSQFQTPMETIPVPPIPSNMRAPGIQINRSQNSSPMSIPLALRPGTSHQPSYDTQQMGHGTIVEPLNRNGLDCNPLPDGGIPYPQQLKVKVHFDPHPSHVTIVVAINIKYRTLVDRIDSKMVKISSSSIARGMARLRYQDQDGDHITIQSDDDVGIAIEEWGTVHEKNLREGIIDDFELFWEIK